MKRGGGVSGAIGARPSSRGGEASELAGFTDLSAAKTEEIAELTPIDPRFIAQGQRAHLQLYRGELKILNGERSGAPGARAARTFRRAVV